VSLDAPRARSVGFLQREGRSWACFLVTYRGRGGRWRGYFSFRPQEADGETDEIRTADIFVEDAERQIDQKARGLGKPLLAGLLSSALETRASEAQEPGQLRTWFRRYLKSSSLGLSGPRAETSGRGQQDVSELRSMYDSYRLDQVAHFITLLGPEEFRQAVDRILEGKTFDFGAKDRLQFAMMVVEFIESHLPLPPFEIWAEDYLAHREAYRLYADTLHREGRLP
jgi:hypothetical protein